MDRDLVELSEALGAACRQSHGDSLRSRPLLVVTAESCTGGWAAQVITHTAGSSEWFERGFVTYADAAKIEMLGVRPETLAQFGAVSVETAKEMAAGALKRSTALIALAITGIAGPTGGSPGKPVGTVCFAWCLRGHEPKIEHCHFEGNREEIRRQSVIHGLTGLLVRARTVPSVA